MYIVKKIKNVGKFLGQIKNLCTFPIHTYSKIGRCKRAKQYIIQFSKSLLPAVNRLSRQILPEESKDLFYKFHPNRFSILAVKA